MRNLFLILFLLFIQSIAFTQKTEYRLAFNSGLFSFTGKSTESVSFINYAAHMNTSYTNNPYGSNNGPCYGVSGILERLTRSRFVFGVDLGYERLSSKIGINSVSVYSGNATQAYDASGETFIHYDFINLQPFTGYRFVTKSINLDLTAGMDFGFCVAANEKGNAKASNGTTYETSVDRKTIDTDIRPRLQLAAYYKRLGIYVGYAWGLNNYKKGYVGGTNDCYSRITRLGASWKLSN